MYIFVKIRKRLIEIINKCDWIFVIFEFVFWFYMLVIILFVIGDYCFNFKVLLWELSKIMVWKELV